MDMLLKWWGGVSCAGRTCGDSSAKVEPWLNGGTNRANAFKF
jgi:hypothetical protein